MRPMVVVLAVMAGIAVGAFGAYAWDGRVSSAEGTWRWAEYSGDLLTRPHETEPTPDPEAYFDDFLATLPSSCDVQTISGTGFEGGSFVVLYRCP
jgi:hypothetical protein